VLGERLDDAFGKVECPRFSAKGSQHGTDFGVHAVELRVEFQPIGASPKPRYTVLETAHPSTRQRRESKG
jgi:hypothetical protein